MSVSVTMPRLGESVTEGTVTRWLKKEGERVEADEPLLEVSTDKVDTEIPAPASGTLSSIRVGEDETVEVGVELAVIDEGGSGAAPAPDAPAQGQPAPEQAPDSAAPEAPQQAQPEPQQAPEPEPQQQPEPEPEPQQPAAQQAPPQQAPPQPAPVAQQAAPVAQQAAPPAPPQQAAPPSPQQPAAAQTAPAPQAEPEPATSNGRAAAAAAPAEAPAAAPAAAPSRVEPSPLRGRTEKMSRLRGVIAKRMTESLQTSAQLTTVVEADVTRIARLRQQAKADFERREGVKLSFLPFFAVATVEALKQHPNVNASIDTEAGTITYHDAEHLGIAVDTERGLLVPVIHDAGDLNLGGMARKIADLAERTRINKVSPDELGGGTFTLTNTGSRGALFDTPIINQPQVGILGTGAVVKRAVVVDDPDLGEVIAVRSVVYLALTYDHRLVDGADAARFLVTVKERLEAGAFESELGLG